MSAAAVALACAAALAGACVQSASGIGFALVLGPVLFAVAGPAEAVGMLLALGLLLNVLVLAAERRPREVRGDDLAPMLGAAVPGLVAGALLLDALGDEVLQVAVGVGVLVAVALAVRRQGRRRADAGRWTAWPVGALAGTLTTATSVNGPPLLLWLQARGARPAQVRDTLAAAFLALNLGGAVAVLALSDEARSLDLALPAGLVPLVVAGHALGRMAFARLSAEAFRALGLALAAIAASASLVDGLMA